MPTELIKRPSPVIVTLPYTGTNMPKFVMERLRNRDLVMTTPDIGLDRLLHGPFDDFSLLRANFHRFLSDVDAALPAEGILARKGMMGVIPLLNAQGAPLWDIPPSPRDSGTWRAMYYAPYHAALASQVARARAEYGYAVVLNCRALHAAPTRGMPAQSPDIRLSTNVRTTCAIELSTRIGRCLREFAFTLDTHGGDDRGGWTIRHYGRPKTHIHALTLELNETHYLDLTGGDAQFDPSKAEVFRKMLAAVATHLRDWRPQRQR